MCVLSCCVCCCFNFFGSVGEFLCYFHRVILIEVEVLLEGIDLEVRVLVLWIRSKGE